MLKTVRQWGVAWMALGTVAPLTKISLQPAAWGFHLWKSTDPDAKPSLAQGTQFLNHRPALTLPVARCRKMYVWSCSLVWATRFILWPSLIQTFHSPWPHHRLCWRKNWWYYTWRSLPVPRANSLQATHVTWKPDCSLQELTRQERGFPGTSWGNLKMTIYPYLNAITESRRCDVGGGRSFWSILHEYSTWIYGQLHFCWSLGKLYRGTCNKIPVSLFWNEMSNVLF